MNLTSFLAGLTPKNRGVITVDNTPGGVGFDPAKLTWGGLPAKLVRIDLEGGDIRYQEDGGSPTATAGGGDLMVEGDQNFVPGAAAHDFRAIRNGSLNGTLSYQPYF